MRPLPGSSASPGHATLDDGASASYGSSASTSSQMTFIVAEETSLNDSPLISEPHSSFSFGSREPKPHPFQGSTSSGANSGTSPPRRDISRSRRKSGDPRTAAPSPVLSCTPSPTTGSAKSPAAPPMTPPMSGLSGSASVLSSPSSHRVSLTGSFTEDQESFVLSALDAFDPETASSDGPGETPGNVDSELVMPTISVPARRPFTDEGKSLGRLKLLLAGESGTGKTSLIRSIVQICEHIIHVDPAFPTSAKVRSGSEATVVVENSQAKTSSASGITETFASTKPYPSWWVPPDQVASARRRKSSGDAVLERNVCFVDTPGCGVSCRPLDTIQTVSQYIEQHLYRTGLRGLSDSDVLSTLSSSGGLLVDAAIYMICSSGLTSEDRRYLQQLDACTSIIPVLAHSDTLSPEQIDSSKQLIADQLLEAGVKPFDFEAQSSHDPQPITIHAVSSESDPDHDNMDASVLMSSQYVQPLVSTELNTLVSRLFSVEGSSRLRHATARKVLSWRKEHAKAGFFSELSGAQGSLVPVGNRSLLPRRNSSRPPWLGEYTSPEHGNAAELHLVNWASDLQRSLSNERIAREREWVRQQQVLREQLRRRPQHDLAMTVTRKGDSGMRRSTVQGKVSLEQADWPSVPQQDPLGLILLASQLRWTSWQVMELAGSVGLAGSVAIWLFL